MRWDFDKYAENEKWNRTVAPSTIKCKKQKMLFWINENRIYYIFLSILYLLIINSYKSIMTLCYLIN